jgi:dihydrofolate reductase
MARLTSFLFITLDGCFAGPGGDISWHPHDAESDEYAVQALKAGHTLLFGRVTYELMAKYWPTPAAAMNAPLQAKGMNAADKVVFSRTLEKAEWNNTRIVKDNIAEEMKRMKQVSAKDMTLLGSGSILNQFAQQGLIDEYEFMLAPVVMGGGTPIFKGIPQRLDLRLVTTKTFNNGGVLLRYRLAEKV